MSTNNAQQYVNTTTSTKYLDIWSNMTWRIHIWNKRKQLNYKFSKIGCEIGNLNFTGKQGIALQDYIQIDMDDRYSIQV